MRSVVLFVALLFVATSADARPDWLVPAIPQSAPHTVDLSEAVTFHATDTAEDADTPLPRASTPEDKWNGSILSYIGVDTSNVGFDGPGRKRHHMVTYGLEDFHPFGSNVSGSVGTRGAFVHFSWPSGQ